MDITIHMLLKACTRGAQQLALINEFWGNGMMLEVRTIPADYTIFGQQTYNSAIGNYNNVTWGSWVNLRKRLLEAGFTVNEENYMITIGLGVH